MDENATCTKGQIPIHDYNPVGFDLSRRLGDADVDDLGDPGENYNTRHVLSIVIPAPSSNRP